MGGAQSTPERVLAGARSGDAAVVRAVLATAPPGSAEAQRLVGAEDKDGLTALMHACNQGRADLVQMVCRGAGSARGCAERAQRAAPHVAGLAGDSRGCTSATVWPQHQWPQGSVHASAPHAPAPTSVPALPAPGAWR